MRAMLLIALILLAGCSALEPTTMVTNPSEIPTTLPDTCEPAYPDFCIPVGRMDLDCDAVGYEFTALEEDPHGFDSNGDGVGCDEEDMGEELVLDN